MTYLDNTFSNSSAVQAHVYFFKIRLVIILTYYMLPIHQFFKKFYPVEKMKKS